MQDQKAHEDVYAVRIFSNRVTAQLRTSAAKHVLRASGAQGVFSSAHPKDLALREGYTVVWAPNDSTLPWMLEKQEPDGQGIAKKLQRYGVAGARLV